MKIWSDVFPRHQFRRRETRVLSGNWTLNGKDIGVPWTYRTTEEDLTYVHDFVLTGEFRNDRSRTILRFGAVDQICDVSVNGTHLAHHEGGYLPFSVDITDVAIVGLNRLIVRATDTLDTGYPYGKQSKNPHGMWYTPVSGIWQPVWIEVIPARDAIRSVRITPDLTGVTVRFDTDAPSVTVQVRVPESHLNGTPGLSAGEPSNIIRLDLRGKTAEPQTVSFASGSAEKTIRIDIPAPRLWTPDDPFLYDVSFDTATDHVEGYFALRTVSLKEIGSHTRFCLNGKPLFLHGVLDQGYFGEDGYLPASPDAYFDEAVRMKALGFNTVRKHIKIEPEAFYEACDRAGLLVIQDMVNSGAYSFLRDTALPTVLGNDRKDTGRTAAPRKRETAVGRPSPFPRLFRNAGREKAEALRRKRFESDLLETIALLFNHPSIVGYTIFNEGWGQFDSDRLYALAKAADPTRFTDATSGWFAQNDSDCESVHVYFRSKHLRSEKPGKMLFLSECGGFTRKIAGHSATDADPAKGTPSSGADPFRGSSSRAAKRKKTYGYGGADSEEALTGKIEELYRDMVLRSIPDGLAGCIYTQTADVEGEINGLYTADRAVCKVDPARMREIAARINETAPYKDGR